MSGKDNLKKKLGRYEELRLNKKLESYSPLFQEKKLEES